jgi:hypothetical protein
MKLFREVFLKLLSIHSSVTWKNATPHSFGYHRFAFKIILLFGNSREGPSETACETRSRDIILT